MWGPTHTPEEAVIRLYNAPSALARRAASIAALVLSCSGVALLSACDDLVGLPFPDGGPLPGPDGGAAALVVTWPEDGTVLSTTTVDVQVSLSPEAAATDVSLTLLGQPVETQPVGDAADTVTFPGVDVSAWDATEQRVTLRAIASTGDGEPVRSAPVAFVVDTRAGGRAPLAEVSDKTPHVSWGTLGTPSFVHMDVPAPGDDAIDKAFALLAAYPDLFRLDDPRRVLAPERVRTLQDGDHEVRFEQHAAGLPVDSAFVTVVLDDGDERAVAVAGRYLPELPEPAAPRLDGRDAEDAALAHLSGRGEGLFVTGDTRRVIYDPALFDPSEASAPRAAWRVFVQGRDVENGWSEHWELFVDPQSGEVRRVLTRAHELTDVRVKVLNANGKAASDGASSCMSSFATRVEPACFENVPLRSDGCNANADADGEAADARVESLAMHDWLVAHFGWETFHQGGIIKDFVNVTFDSGPNAMSLSGWCDNQLQFSDDWMVPDVLYHELGHRLVRESGTDFNSQGESGALHEHYGDVFAALVEGERDGTGFDPVLGEDLASVVRHMQNPASQGDPALYANRFTGSADNGGVHTNSAIPSRAIALLASGGALQGSAIQPIGPDKVRALTWRGLMSGLTGPSTQFAGYANALVSIAGTDLDPGDACTVRNAFAAVGVIPGDADCDGTLDTASNDDDNDTVADGADNCAQTFNVSQRDGDGDGIGDACDPDLDGDGVTNADDNCVRVANAGQDDTDGDGRGDACQDLDGDLLDGHEDNCPTVANYAQRDADGDGDGDACDPDDDGDGVLDGDDNCPAVSNPLQGDRDGDGQGDACADTDGDGLSDALDPCPDDYSYEDPDRDDDGLLDACEDDDDDDDGVLDADDNCDFTVNPGQLDSDGDGVGDACDNCVGTANPAQDNLDGDDRGDACDPDDDADGIPDEDDNCPAVANPRQADLDDDGVGAACGDDYYEAWRFRETVEQAVWFEANFGAIGALDDLDDLDDAPPFVGVSTPIDVCEVALCQDLGRAPDGLRLTLRLEANHRFRAAVLDGEGNVVERLEPEDLGAGENAELGGTLTFAPEMSAWYQTDAVDGFPYQGATYKLRVFSDPEYAASDGQRIDLSVARDVPP